MSDQARLRSTLAKLYPGADDTWPAFERILHAVEFTAGTYLSQAGKVANAIYFITAGTVRVVADYQEKETCLDFAFPGMFSTSYASYITQSPAAVSLQAITPVTAIAFYYEDLHTLYRSHPATEKTGRLLAEQQYLRKYQRELSFLQYTAAERYQQLLTEHPEVVREIPLKYIASYLGIAPESLSRIRRSIRHHKN
jgi:CRP-like cAMP-binding protein